MKFLLSAAITICVLCPPLTFGEDWPNWRGPRFDGISKETLPGALPNALPIIWNADVGIGFSSFAVVGDRVLTIGNKEERDSVWCLNAKNRRSDLATHL